MRLSLRLSASALLALAVVLPWTAFADSASDSQFAADTNQARSDNSLRGYSVSSDLTSVARRWAAYMASHRTLEHNPSYSSQVCCWRSVGENVGVGASVSQIQQAFMNSSPHRDNILSHSFTQAGFGTARGSDGRLYVDELFRQPQHQVSAAPPVVHVTAPVTRAAPVRATRAQPRHPLVVRRHPAAPAPSATTVLARRLAVAEAQTKQAQPDPVLGALAFVRVMDVLAGSAR